MPCDRPSPARRSRPGRTLGPGFAAAFAAALAWAPSAHGPGAGPSSAASYAEMGDRLAAIYPASGSHAVRIVRAVHAAADRHGLEPCLVMGVIARESAFDPEARRRGDVGLMQLNLAWHPDLVARAGGERGLTDPERNVSAGTELLARYRRLAGDEVGALRRYHGLGKRNDYAERVRASARHLAAAGACVAEGPVTDDASASDTTRVPAGPGRLRNAG